MQENKSTTENIQATGSFIKVKTWLPVFPGFYGTIFNYEGDDIDQTLFNDPSAVDDDLLKYICNDLLWDNWLNQDYEKEVSKHCTEFIEGYCKENFPGIIKSIEFENLYSPKEYNFANNSINVIMQVDFDALLKAFISHEKSADFLKDTYTSCSGFISHYPNNLKDWIADAFEDQKHTTAAMLQFLLTADDDYDDDSVMYCMYEYVSENVYPGNYFDYDSMITSINEKYTYNDDLKDFSDLEGFTPIKGGNRFMQLLTGIGLFDNDPEDMPESDFIDDYGLFRTI